MTGFRKTTLSSQPYVGIRATVQLAEMPKTLGVLFPEIHGHILRAGKMPAGMPFTIYHSMEGDTVGLECGMPVADPLGGTGRIRAGELPGGPAVTVTHVGPYEGLGQTWQALMEWVGGQGLVAAAPPWEVYVTDPGAEPDSSKWRTDIFFPVR